MYFWKAGSFPFEENHCEALSRDLKTCKSVYETEKYGIILSSMEGVPASTS